jgi:hypothetical protein
VIAEHRLRHCIAAPPAVERRADQQGDFLECQQLRLAHGFDGLAIGLGEVCDYSPQLRHRQAEMVGQVNVAKIHDAVDERAAVDDLAPTALALRDEFRLRIFSSVINHCDPPACAKECSEAIVLAAWVRARRSDRVAISHARPGKQLKIL